MPSLKDIANEAGVSVATVSAVLGNKAEALGIKEATREKVRRVAEALQYRPNLAARGLRMKRGYTIGLLLHSSRELIYAELLAEIQARLLPHGYAGLCAFWDTEEEARAAFRLVLDRGVDGLITCHDDLSLIPPDVPAVLFVQRHPDRDGVCKNAPNAMKQAVRYLVGLGHTRLGSLNVNRGMYEPVIEKALCELGVKTPFQWTEHATAHYAESARHSMRTLLARPAAKRPTALICRNDTVAMIAMSEAGRHGLSVPRDLSVLGFDSVSLGALTNPPLTSFGVPPAVLARHLVDLMIRRLTEPGAPRQELMLEQKLTERGSCIPPPKPAGRRK